VVNRALSIERRAKNPSGPTRRGKRFPDIELANSFAQAAVHLLDAPHVDDSGEQPRPSRRPITAIISP